MKIEKYVPAVTPCPFDWNDEMGGYDPASGNVTPFTDVESRGAEELLWNIALAVEAGKCDTETFLSSFFKSRDDVLTAADSIDEYADEGGFWVNDRIFHAFFAMHSDESKARTFEDIADFLREQAEEEFPSAGKRAKRA